MSFFFEEGKATEKHKTQTKKRKIRQSEKAHFTQVNKKKREETHDNERAHIYLLSLSFSLSLSLSL